MRSSLAIWGISLVTTESRITFSCNTLLCFTFCKSAGGVTSGSLYIKTAVPGTCMTRSVRIFSANWAKGIAPVPKRCCKIERPRFQVVIKVKISAPSTSGSQPPSAILTKFAPQNANSITAKKAVKARDPHNGQPQCSRCTVNKSKVVTTMVVVTATP